MELSERPRSSDPFEVEPAHSSSKAVVPERMSVVHIAADGRVAVDGIVTDDAGLRAAARDPGTTGGVHVFEVDRGGLVRNSELRRSTGSELLDRAVAEMIARAQPLPGLPEGLAGDRLELLLPIVFQLR